MINLYESIPTDIPPFIRKKEAGLNGVNTSTQSRFLEDMAKRILSEVKRIIPPLSPSMYKGQAGRVGVIGGSQE